MKRSPLKRGLQLWLAQFDSGTQMDSGWVEERRDRASPIRVLARAAGASTCRGGAWSDSGTRRRGGRAEERQSHGRPIRVLRKKAASALAASAQNRQLHGKADGFRRHRLGGREGWAHGLAIPMSILVFSGLGLKTTPPSPGQQRRGKDRNPKRSMMGTWQTSVRITGVSDPRGGGVNRVANSISNLGLNLLHKINLTRPTHTSYE